ncbi:MAG: hypothetical protein RLZZ126_1116 [Pseudomonadota bacterium]|jgi:hypothetical protein
MSEPESLPQGQFEGREAFQDLVRQAFAQAAREGWREIIVCDASFEDWPLREREVAESLNAWATAGRRFTMLATRYDAVQRLHARFVNWRVKWSHLVDCRQCRQAAPVDFPSALLGPDWVMQRLDVPRCNGVAGREPARRVALRELLEERLRASSPGFAASTLGL